MKSIFVLIGVGLAGMVALSMFDMLVPFSAACVIAICLALCVEIRERRPALRQIERKDSESMDVKRLIDAEIKLINTMMDAHGIQARTITGRTLCVKSSFISYGLKVAHGERISKIESMQRELANELTRQRNQFGMRGTVPVRMSDYPLAIEVPHPSPTVLRWTMDALTGVKPHSMLLGRSYLNGTAHDEIAKFDDVHHVLTAGITGAGKSVLLQMMMLSLCHNTPPNELEIVLIDLKNEDMLPFKRLPHVVAYAGSRDTAVKAIQYVVAEKEKRVAREGYKPYRLVLWIDELAQLAAMREVAEMLGDLASIGRGKLINLVGATQYPTEKGGLGGLLKANFPVRLVGMVAPGQSHIATGRPQTHADMLPGKGSFLRCQGPQVLRFQSYHIREDEVVKLVSAIGDKWHAPVHTKRDPSLVCKNGEPPLEPVRTGSKSHGEPVQTDFEPLREPLEPVQEATVNHLFPLSERRPLTDVEAAEVRRLNEEMSKNALCSHVYGSKSGRYIEWINEALNRKVDEKIINLAQKRVAKG